MKDKIVELAKKAEQSTIIDNSLYIQHDVKRGLRDISGKGVVCGLTEISEIVATKKDKKGQNIPCEGELYYRGISVKDLAKGFKRFGFEETTYLLLFGTLPTSAELKSFTELLEQFCTLPKNFVRDLIMKAPSVDMMNALGRGVLSLYFYDDIPDDTSIPNVLTQVLRLIAQFPLLTVYSYQTAKYHHDEDNLVILRPQRGFSIAENILYLLRHNKGYSELEAKILDLCLILHAEHGGGNNSTFTTHVVSSTGADTYATVASALGSLKGPRHGGANIKVMQMFKDMKNTLKDYSDESVTDYLKKLLNKEAFDKAGLIYGMGHAVYSLSDPRADILKSYVEKLAMEKNLGKDFELYKKVERLAPQIISEKRKIYKGVSVNIDFYSGFVYKMLEIPPELFTPLFAVSRMAGWGAHRIEELSNNGKIIRPDYKSVAKRQKYISLTKRNNVG